MKKIKLLFVFVVALIAASCSNGPGDVAIQIAEAEANGSVNDVVAFVHGTDEERESLASMINSFAPGKMKKQQEKRGKLESAEVIEEVMSEDGKSCKVKLKLVFEKTGEKQDTEKLTLVDGKWGVENPLANK